MRYCDGRTLTPTLPIRVGTVGTPMICVPNHLEKLGTWSERYEGDHDFLASTMRLRGDQPILHGDVVAEVTPR